MSWSAAQYTKFEDERTRPVRDLIAHIPTISVDMAVDLGCGPGNSTELLKARFPDAVIMGVDSSADMIEAARKRLPDVILEIDDIVAWRNPGPFDVILANAALQWVPNHESLLPRLIDKLGDGGSLAVQIPDNLEEPAHILMREIAADGPWSDKLAEASSARAARRSAEWYYGILSARAGKVDIWRTTYYHLLAGGAEAVTEWFKGSGLRPFLDPLDAIERSTFLTRYQAAVSRAYPALDNGAVLLPFPRLFFIATR
jgi:trans-aconitate 2-methyltransferase